ncbi:Argininosuccinate lyase [Variovorax sp. PBL-H6]|uniref:tripartite tricarboxylate transporter substrate binding protein n=1 Tax=Variovorax sp. PBL-H6 TaxID=434009 RepID=UPI001319781D|nr:tripartite tricarboxylate transporter substrate binding protein [Variovorax sp. PBL-H6]VTU33388.1 Argininosuccinate lyase [Variovorax sp. PBL-H6]
MHVTADQLVSVFSALSGLVANWRKSITQPSIDLRANKACEVSVRSRSRSLGTGFIWLGAMLHAQALAQAPWAPTKPVTLVVPYAAGGGTDAVARALARELEALWSKPVIVENVPGANGLIGTQRVVQARPDGHTILLQVPGVLLTKHMQGFKGVDPIARLQPVSIVSEAANVLVASGRLPAESFADFVTLCKSKRSCSLATVDNAGRVLGQQLSAEAGIPNLTIVPYRGAGGQMVTDLVANNVDVAISGLTVVLPHQKTGALRVLATLGHKRSTTLPDTPSIAELGLGQLVSISWVGIFAPKDSPAPIIQSLEKAMRTAVQGNGFRKAVEATGGQQVAVSSANFSTQLRSEEDRLSRLAERFKLD